MTPASPPTRSPSSSTNTNAPTGRRCPSTSCLLAPRWWSTRPACSPPPAFHELVTLADRNRWRVALIGDPRQLQGVGRGGLLAELCANGRVEQLDTLHRFTHPWEAAASLRLRAGELRALDAYEAHGRIVPGTLDAHLDRLAKTWIDHHDGGRSIAIVASTNDHVDTINQAIQAARRTAGHLEPDRATRIAAGETAFLGDIVATRRNDRTLTTTSGEPVRNRDTWVVTAIGQDGAVTVTHQGGHGDVTLPVEYVHTHVRLGYAATEHGWQSDTVDTAIALTSPATTRRGLYVAATRGSDVNTLCVVTASEDIAEARDVLEAIIAADRADVPATTQRRTLAATSPREAFAAASAPTPRCEIPDWFPTALANAHRQLLDAQNSEAQRSPRRAQADAAVANADTIAAAVSTSTAADRDALQHAEARAADARRQHTAAAHQLDTAPRLQRRRLRNDLHIADRQLERAETYLERTRQRATPALGATPRPSRTSAPPTTRRIVDRSDATPPVIGQHQLHVRALNTWKHWAEGHQVPDSALRTTAAVLTQRRGPEQQLAGSLREDLATRPPEQTPHRFAPEHDPHAHVPQRDFGIER